MIPQTKVTTKTAVPIVAAMHRLASIVAAHGSVLVLDTASTRVQSGLLRANSPPIWRVGGDDSSVDLFVTAQAVLADAGLSPSAIGAYLFCDGPGSQLGIRTACMALRTWQALRPTPVPVFAYRSLLACALSHQAGGAEPPFAVIADARRACWHAVRIAADGTASSVLRVSNDDLRLWPERLLQPAGFRSWSAPTRPTTTCDYDCSQMLTRLIDVPLLTLVGDPEPWQSAPVVYQTWSGNRHREAQDAAAAQQ